MFRQVISILLILAVAACPLWCSSGLIGCCAAEATVQHGPVDNAPTCCPCDDDKHHSPRNVPYDKPTKSSEHCQGICGGAVLEKPCQLSGASDAFIASIDVAHVLVSQPTDCRARLDSPACFFQGNAGRTLRTLHMSFLC